jgi:hypothetical protein
MELKKGLLKVSLFDMRDIDNYIKAGWKLIEKPIVENIVCEESIIEEIVIEKHKSNKKVKEIENKDNDIIE